VSKTPEDPKKLAEDHWAYLSGILRSHGEKESTITLAGIHYITAMIHGYKHGVHEALRLAREVVKND